MADIDITGLPSLAPADVSAALLLGFKDGAPDVLGLVEAADLIALFAAADRELIIAVSDETTEIEVGGAKTTFRMPYAMNLTEVRASCTAAPTDAAIQVDINEGGVSILSTKLTIDAGEKTSITAAVPAVISDPSLSDDAEMTIDIDAVGATFAGAGLKVLLIGTRI